MMPPRMSPPREDPRGPEIKLSGVVERILWLDEETHFTIAELSPEAGDKTIVLGNMTGLQCGETVDLVGFWERHPQHGPQLRVKSFTSRLPSSVHGIRKYLGSGLIKGIGKTYADKIVAKFGVRTFDIISNQSARLREVDGIGPGRAKSIKAAWEDQKALREVMVFLQTYGVTNALCLRIVKAYGQDAKKVLTTEPYRVCREVEGVGFKTADKIARNLGLPTAGPQRVDAGILHSLEELEGEGHSAYPEEGLLEKSTELLEVDRAIVQDRMKVLMKENAVGVLDTKGVRLLQLRPQENAERSIATSIRRLRATPSSLPAIHAEKAVAWAQERAGFGFSEAQSAAVMMALRSKVGVLTGGPGTGKTTILKALCDILVAKRVRVLLGAPTGRAAKRMQEATRVQASTIHRLLKFDPAAGGFTANAENPLSADFVIVDESSMLDTKLAAALLRAIPGTAHLLLVGDVNQLPSVGAGNVLGDLIESGAAEVTSTRSSAKAPVRASSPSRTASCTRTPPRRPSSRTRPNSISRRTSTSSEPTTPRPACAWSRGSAVRSSRRPCVSTRCATSRCSRRCTRAPAASKPSTPRSRRNSAGPAPVPAASRSATRSSRRATTTTNWSSTATSGWSSTCRPRAATCSSTSTAPGSNSNAANRATSTWPTR